MLVDTVMQDYSFFPKNPHMLLHGYSRASIHMKIWCQPDYDLFQVTDVFCIEDFRTLSFDSKVSLNVSTDIFQ